MAFWHILWSGHMPTSRNGAFFHASEWKYANWLGHCIYVSEHLPPHTQCHNTMLRVTALDMAIYLAGMANWELPCSAPPSCKIWKGRALPEQLWRQSPLPTLGCKTHRQILMDPLTPNRAGAHWCSPFPLSPFSHNIWKQIFLNKHIKIM